MAQQEPVERFQPTSGTALGWTGVVVAVLVLGYAVVTLPAPTSLPVAAGALFAGVVVWVTQLRPRVTAYPRELLIRGSVRDVRLPLHAVDEVTLTQTLTVRSGGKRYVCVGIGRSVGADMRQRMRAHSAGDGLGLNRVTDLGPGAGGDAGGDAGRGPQMTYHDFVLTRIDDLVKAARAAGPRAGERVRTSYAVPEVAALVVTGLALVVSLLLR